MLLFFPLSGLPLDMCFVADPRALVTLGSCRAHVIPTAQKPKGRMTQCGFASSFVSLTEVLCAALSMDEPELLSALAQGECWGLVPFSRLC